MFVDSLRGQALQRLLAVICAVAFLEQGYDQGVMNGFLTLDSFLETLPQLNTLTTKGAQQAHNANIQGESPLAALEEMRDSDTLSQASPWQSTKSVAALVRFLHSLSMTSLAVQGLFSFLAVW